LWRPGDTRIQKEAKANVGFGQVALDAAKKCKYKPAIGKDGKPVAVWITHKIVFRLEERR
jgi:outer membrane biosynthesis protein TonB